MPPAISWQHLMNSWATGLIVRFLAVTIPTGHDSGGNLTGRTLSGSCLPPKRNIEAGSMVRNRPVASRLMRSECENENTVACGKLRPLARNASAARHPVEAPSGTRIYAHFTIEV